jgi:flagellar basal-body rod protein FlgC
MKIDPPRRPALLPIPSQPVVRPMFKTLGIAGSGLAAQRQRMENIAQNIANADVTRGADGQPFKRREAVLEAATAQNAVYGEQGNGVGTSAGNGVFGSNPFTVPSPGGDSAKSIEVPVLQYRADSAGPGPNGGEFGVRVAGIAEDVGEGRLQYEPGHPDADANGYVRYPDINTTQEMVNMMDAKRLFEANATVFQVAKSILRASLDI